MAGSLLGQDQIKKVNLLYGQIYTHIKSLLKEDATPVDLMRVHVLTEYLDTTELSKIFMELSFLSPAEKRALVRAAIFDVVLKRDVQVQKIPLNVVSSEGQPKLTTYTPNSFNLNVATAGPAPVIPADTKAGETPTAPAVLSKLDEMRKEAKEAYVKAEASRTAALSQNHKVEITIDEQVGFKPNIATVEDHQGK